MRYDVFHYYFGQSFFRWGSRAEPSRRWFADLRLAKRAGRRVLMTLQGCDVRLSDRSAERNEITMCHLGHCESAASCRSGQDRARRLLIDRILPLAERVFVLNPELAHDVPAAEFLPYACVDVEAIAPCRRNRGADYDSACPQRHGEKRHSFCSQGHRAVAAAAQIVYIEVKPAPHAEAMKLYAQADLVIDQLLAGWYGGFAVEMMAMGKPVVCYIRAEDLKFVPPAMVAELPLIAARPDTLEDDLEAAIARRAEWPAWGHRGGGVRPPLAPSATDRPSDDRQSIAFPRAASAGAVGSHWLRQCCLPTGKAIANLSLNCTCRKHTTSDITTYGRDSEINRPLWNSFRWPHPGRILSPGHLVWSH